MYENGENMNLQEKQKVMIKKDNKKARILAITLDNFKSFAKKTTIPFYEGFNAIIGPNGSGKSNIVDAFVFVLGSSSKDIRAGRMEHVIYNGGYGRKPAEYAEVSITINNSDRIIKDFDEDLITISRRVMRGGNAYYRINDKVVSKEKVLDVLESLGITNKMYNIIQQGDVINLIKMRPKERREIIDRVAGIDEYNRKKENALKELEIAEKNLQEAKLILEQKKEFLDKLKQDRDLALKVKELEEKKSALKIQLTYSRYKILEGEINKIKESIDVKEKEYYNIKKKIEGYDLDIESVENELKVIDEKMVSSVQKDQDLKQIDEVLKNIYERENKINQNLNEIQLLRKTVENYERMLSSQREGREYEVVKLLEKEGIKVYGLFRDLIRYDNKFSLSIEIAMGNHSKDIVVESENDALRGIEILKRYKIGRMRFLPLDRLEPHKVSAHAEASKSLPGIIGLASEIVEYDKKFKKAVDYVFRDTLVAETPEDARKIRRLRVVTLEGDLFESGGAITGGYMAVKDEIKRVAAIKEEIRNAEKKIKLLEKENEILEEELSDLKALLDDLKKKQKEISKDVTSLMDKKNVLEKKLRELKEKRKEDYERMLILENEINKLKIRKARLEAEFDNLVKDYEQFKDKIEEMKIEDPLKIENLIRRIEEALREIGLVNMKAIEEYEEFKKEYEEYENKVRKLYEEKKSIEQMIEKIEEKRRAIFMEAFDKINENFSKLFREIAKGDAKIELEREGDIDSGLIIKAQPYGKKLQIIDSLSGGEKTLVSLTFLFAIMHYRKAPFYLLDEVDAALDKKNSEIIGNMVAEYSKDTQFIVISHNDITVQKAQRVYGVTMQKGISQVFSVVLNEEK